MNTRYIILGTLVYLGLILSQAFVFDLVSISGFGNPMIYPLIILIIPVSFPAAVVMLIAFFAGLGLDIITNSGGIHAGALTMMAFARFYILRLLEPASGYDKSSLPVVEDQGLKWFMLYSFLMILVHQTTYYLIERFSFTNLLSTFFRALSGVVISVILIWLVALLFSPSTRKRKR